MRKKLTLLLMLLLAACSLGVLTLTLEQKNLSEKMIRLHVVANSDSAFDQAVKLQVRDAVLEKAGLLLAQSDNPEQTLTANLQTLADTAQETLQRLNVPSDVRVSYQNERFPTRDYDTFSLPAGVYKTLRVIIGSGRGHNWWCVVYPSLCLSASMDEFEKAAAAADFSQGEIQLITEADTQWKYRFKTIELLEKFKNMIFSD